MPTDKLAARTTRVTGLPRPARKSAACPAEFAPPKTATGSRLEFGCGVEDPGAFELGPARQRQRSVLGTAGDDDGPPWDPSTVAQDGLEGAVASPKLRYLARTSYARAELPSLNDGPRGELGSADARREAQVVLDARACCGLAAGCDGVEQHGA
jgi:hypothetical protein